MDSALTKFAIDLTLRNVCSQTEVPLSRRRLSVRERIGQKTLMVGRGVLGSAALVSEGGVGVHWALGRAFQMEGPARANPGAFEERKFGRGIGGAGQQHGASSGADCRDPCQPRSLALGLCFLGFLAVIYFLTFCRKFQTYTEERLV